MAHFYDIIKKEINTEKSQKELDSRNLRTFVALSHIKIKEIVAAFEKSFGYKPLKINSLTFTKNISNRKNRTVRIVKLKKFFILLPQGKDLTLIQNNI